MGLALYIELERNIDGFDPFVNGKAAAIAGEVIESLAKEVVVKPLMDFFSVNDEIARFAKEEAGIDVQQGEFFDPSEGLITIEALINGIQKRSSSIKNAPRILEDLKEYEVVLRKARESQVRWRFAFDV
jgi:hypothetical protein